MNDQRLPQLIAELDADVPRDDAKVKLRQYGGGPDECELIANKLGFLRLGVEMLRAAYAPLGIGNQPETVPADLDYLWLHDEGSIVIDCMIRRDPEAQSESGGSHWRDAAAMAFAAAFTGLTLVGFLTVATWFGGLLTSS